MALKIRVFIGDTWFLIAAIVLLLSPSLFDLHWLQNATAGFGNTRGALFSVIGVLVTAGLVNSWNKRRADKRDKLRYEGMSKVAFRSLAQTVNDVGRILLAPVVGADLYSAGIPGFTPEHHHHNLANLLASSIQPDFAPKSGVWDDDVSRQKLAVNLVALCSQPGFPELMFRTTSAARRRLQSAMADWAPVMVAVPGANEHLARGWPLADQVVLLLESWRHLTAGVASGSHSQSDLDGVVADYTETIRQYQVWIQDLIPLAGLPTRR
jgi:hypothetical protein